MDQATAHRTASRRAAAPGGGAAPGAGSARRRARALLALAACGAAEETEPIPYQGRAGAPVPAVIDGNTPYVEAVLIDREPRHLLIDTGAPQTSIDPAAFGIAPDGPLSDVELVAFGLEFPGRTIDLGSFQGALLTCGGLRPAGLLGGDVLTSFQLAADYRGGRVALLDGPPRDLSAAGGADPAEAVPFDLGGGGHSAGNVRVGATRVLVDVEVEGIAATFLLDTGASYVALSPLLLDRLGADRPRLCCIQIVSTLGTFESALVRLADLAVAGAAWAHDVVATALPRDNELLESISHETGRDVQGLLGGSYLREFAFTVDYPGRELRLARYRDPAGASPDEFVGPGFEIGRALDRDGRCVPDWFAVAHIYQRIDLSPHDLRQGDRVTAIGDRMLVDMDLAEVHALVRSLPAGEEVPFAVARAPEPGGGDRPDGVVLLPIQDLLPVGP